MRFTFIYMRWLYILLRLFSLLTPMAVVLCAQSYSLTIELCSEPRGAGQASTRYAHSLIISARALETTGRNADGTHQTLCMLQWRWPLWEWFQPWLSTWEMAPSGGQLPLLCTLYSFVTSPRRLGYTSESVQSFAMQCLVYLSNWVTAVTYGAGRKGIWPEPVHIPNGWWPQGKTVFKFSFFFQIRVSHTY